MATARRNRVAPAPGPVGYTGPLPRDIAAGPAVEIWAPEPRRRNPAQDIRVAAITEWRLAGSRWSEAHGLAPNAYRDLLPDGVRDAADALWLELVTEREVRSGRRRGAAR